jgi:7,8-dihydropterin-6-yl-methyl-4-(beta-D-ribofuranosyl)aminobenzene 5'-phosphate synthase
MALRITSLVENAKAGDHLACEPGLSLLIEWRGKTILLDTGASEYFIDNADVLDKDLSKVDFVVLSHSHSDHSGGIRTLCASTRKKFKLVMNPRFFEKKFIREGDFLRYIGNDFNQEFLQIENVATVFPVTDKFALMEGVYVISAIDSVAAFEDEPNDFILLKGEQYLPDGFADEQALVLDLPQGLVVVSGCAHRGIVNICEAVKKQLNKPVHAIIGGLHLKSSGEERIRQTAAYILSEGIEVLALGHCTGEVGVAGLERHGVKIQPLSSGSVFEFED